MGDEQKGNLAAALAQATKLLASQPDLAAQQAREILKVVPGQKQARFLLAVALRAQGLVGEARDILVDLANAEPNAADIHYELGLTRSALGERDGAISALARAARINGKHVHAWRALGDEKMLVGDTVGADAAYARHIEAAANDPKLVDAAIALRENNLAVAERILKPFLKEHPTDVSAMRMLAELAARLHRYEDAEALLRRAVELAPGFSAARQNLASIYYRHNKPDEALQQINILLKDDPHNFAMRGLKGAVLGQIGEYDAAIELYEGLLKDHPQQPGAWTSYGHSLKTIGRQVDSVAAYRRAIALRPNLGEAYWSLANLKTYGFTPEDIDAMQAQAERGDISDEDRFHLEFALGKALEDAGEYARSFMHYKKANALRRKSAPYNADETSSQVHRLKAVFTPDFLRQREGAGAQESDPIFIVGLPRSGSTLIEQILSSHSQVEGTMELHDIGAIARGLGGRINRGVGYPEALIELPSGQFRTLGEEYLSRTKMHRKFGRLFFIDKMPNNFFHVGLIHLTLPNAKIIDARRHPMGCAFSCFKQHFARGQAFTYDLQDIGRFYADYVKLMAHYDVLMPGRVHRVIYENMVADPEGETRRLLEYCGLPFEDSCLRFYENDRAVRTASSEQVRQPIFREAVEHWQNFEPWLSALKTALGPVLAAYPFTPTF